ncbi:hypothetical protein [Pseudobdellovibrio sp. HCB154]|uniref:hypothetical protein n=1 Tax=Pseudobdellovibrio sp. HCB154 TaxID=3386277 RepID=UPI0039175966
MRNIRGQVVVEYLLIMVLMVAIAAGLTKKLVGRGDDDSSQGMIIQSWSRMIKVIGNDLPDCAKQQNFNTPNCPP